MRRLDASDTAGGPDWLRRLKEALQFAAESTDQPWAPPWLLSPSKANLSLWVTRLKFSDQGVATAEATHDRYKLWAAEGAHRSEIASIQKEISAASRGPGNTAAASVGTPQEPRHHGKRPASPLAPSQGDRDAQHTPGWTTGWGSSAWYSAWSSSSSDVGARWQQWLERN